MIRFLRWVIVWRAKCKRVKSFRRYHNQGQFLNAQRRTMDYPGRYL